jgi:hypothetical protein
MATNRDLLREAIADAKAVKETAIANAKAALTESFTPFLREKLSAKIQEMDKDDVDEDVDEMVYDEVEENEGLDEISLDELLAELEEGDSKEMEDENLYEAKEEKEEEMSIEDMSEDDLKSFIEDVIKDMVANKELEAGHEGMEDEEGAEEMEAPEEEEDEDVNIEELLESEELLEDVGFIGDLPLTADAIKYIAIVLGVVGALALDSFKDNIKAFFSGNKNKKITNKELKDLADKAKASKSEKPESEKPKSEPSDVSSKEELAESYSVIRTLKNELNEINLLNSKLLYTNKIFRSKSLSESQKIKVLTAFDKAKTKKEAQLVYETLQESLKVSINTKSSIKESLGSASRSLGNASAKPIIEVDNQFARWQMLAGIKK